MVALCNPFDELPYLSLPIEWTAPERLALASILHGGPRPPLETYRVLELGCADGANLLPLAAYRKHAYFVGVDGSQTQINSATDLNAALKLPNVEFICADFRTMNRELNGKFDFIIAHGVFSWVSPDVRDALMDLCAQRLSPNGLLYLNYNALPGWNVRGLVRDFLLAQTAGTMSLPVRAQMAQAVSAKIAGYLPVDGHPYSQLLANEFRFVCENHFSYVAHEYLSAENHAFWRSDFLSLAEGHKLAYVADADFSYPSRQTPEEFVPRLSDDQLMGRSLEDTVDLLCYRQLHSPIFTHTPLSRRPPSLEEFSNLLIASCLTPASSSSTATPMFQHPSGYEVEAKDEVVSIALRKLRPLWPRGLRVGAVFPDVSHVMADIILLQRNGLIELRCVEPAEFEAGPEPLRLWERMKGGYFTTPYHTREASGSSSQGLICGR